MDFYKMLIIESDYLVEKCRETPREKFMTDVILRSALIGSIDKIIDFLRSIEKMDGRVTNPSWKELHDKKNSASSVDSEKALWDIIDNDIPRIRESIRM